uniref:ELYS beta-propeller domain-containing protein n=1 Tax=Plectus sambesii TaxID=2011161 RepID=A0A914UX22_9BILA
MAPPVPRRQKGQILESYPFRQKSSMDEENCSIKSGRILTDGMRELDLCYFASDNYLRLLSCKNGEEVASCAFADTAIIADAAYCSIDEAYDGLVIGVNEGDKSAVCFLDIKSSRVLKAVKIKRQVTRVETILDGGREAASRRTVLHKMFTDCRQVVAVGTVDGHVFLVDIGVDERVMHPDNTVASARDPKGYYDLLRKFHSEDGFLFNSRTLQPELMSVLCLRFCEKANLLAVGFEFGGIGLFSLSQSTAKLLFFNCPLPALHMTFQEPENDPKPIMYLWIGHEGNEQMQSRMQLTQIGFKEKRMHETLGPIYDEMESMRDVLMWQPPDAERIISLSTIPVSAKQWTNCKMDDSVEGLALDGVDTGHVLMAWADSNLQARGAVFDLNGWYNKRMASIVRFDRTGQCPFLSIFHLNSVGVDSADFLHLAAIPQTVHRFQMGSTEIVDQLYYPSALRFTAVALTDTSVLLTTVSSLQDQVVADLESSCENIFDNPAAFYRELSDVGLIQPRTTAVSSANKERQCQAALSTLLCLHRTRALGRLATIDSLKKKISDWLWTEVGGAKKRMDEITAALFSVGGMGLSRTSRLMLSHQVHLFESSEIVMKKLLEGNTMEETEADELRCRLAAVQALAFYGQLVSFMTDYGLLPETSDLRDVIAKIRRDVQKRRDSARRARRSLWIDELVEEMQSTSGPAPAWPRLPADEWYPPTTILNLLSPILLLELSKQSKLKLLGYFLLDIFAAAEGTDVAVAPLFDKFCAHALFGAANLRRSIAYYWKLDAGLRPSSPISWEPPKFVPSPSDEEANKPEWRKLYEKPLLRLPGDEEKRLKELVLAEPRGAHLWNMWLVEKFRFDELLPVKPTPVDGAFEAACSAVVSDIQRRMPKVSPRPALPYSTALQHAPPAVASKIPEIRPREVDPKKKRKSHLDHFSMQQKPPSAAYSPLRKWNLKRDATTASSQLTEEEQRSEDEAPLAATTPKRSRTDYPFKSPGLPPHSSRKANDTLLDSSKYLDIRSLLQTPPVVASVRHTPSSVLASASALSRTPQSILKSHKKLVLNWNDGDDAPSFDRHIRFDLPDSPSPDESSSSLLSYDKSSASSTPVASPSEELERPPRPLTPPPWEALVSPTKGDDERAKAPVVCSYEEQQLDEDEAEEPEQDGSRQETVVYSSTDDPEVLFNFSTSSNKGRSSEDDDEMEPEEGEEKEKRQPEHFHDALERSLEGKEDKEERSMTKTLKTAEDGEGEMSRTDQLSADELDNSMDVEEFVVRSSHSTPVHPPSKPPSNALSALRRQYTGALDESAVSTADSAPSTPAVYRRVTRSTMRIEETSSTSTSPAKNRTPPSYDVKERSFEEQEDPFAAGSNESADKQLTETLAQPIGTEGVEPVPGKIAKRLSSFSSETSTADSQSLYSSPLKKQAAIASKFVFSPPDERMKAVDSSKASASAQEGIGGEQGQVVRTRFSFSSPKSRSSGGSWSAQGQLEDESEKKEDHAKGKDWQPAKERDSQATKPAVAEEAEKMDVEESDGARGRSRTPELSSKQVASPRRSTRSSTVATPQQSEPTTTPPSTPKTPRSAAKKAKQQAPLDAIEEEKEDSVQAARTPKAVRTPKSARKLQLDAIEEEKEQAVKEQAVKELVAKEPSTPPAVDEARKESPKRIVPTRLPSKIRAGRRSLLDPSVDVPTPEHHRRAAKSTIVGGRRKTVSVSDAGKSEQSTTSSPPKVGRVRAVSVGTADAASSSSSLAASSSSPSRRSAAEKNKRASVLKAPLETTIVEEDDKVEPRSDRTPRRRLASESEPEASTVADRLLASPRRSTRSTTVVTPHEEAMKSPAKMSLAKGSPTKGSPPKTPRSAAKKAKQLAQLDDIEEMEEEAQPPKKVPRTPRAAKKLELEAVEEEKGEENEKEKKEKTEVKSPKSTRKASKMDEQSDDSAAAEKVPARRPSNIRAGRRSVIDPSVDVPTPVMLRQAKSMAERRRRTVTSQSSESSDAAESSAPPATHRRSSTASSSASISASPSRRNKRSTMLKEPESATITEEGEEQDGDSASNRSERMKTPDLDSDAPSSGSNYSLRRSGRKSAK